MIAKIFHFTLSLLSYSHYAMAAVLGLVYMHIGGGTGPADPLAINCWTNICCMVPEKPPDANSEVQNSNSHRPLQGHASHTSILPLHVGNGSCEAASA